MIDGLEILTSFEEKVKSSIDVERLKEEVEGCFRYTLSNDEHNDVKETLSSVLGKDGFFCKFSGIRLHLLNAYSRKPYILVRLDVLNDRSKQCIALYEVEYGLDGEVKDDYFNLI